MGYIFFVMKNFKSFENEHRGTLTSMRILGRIGCLVGLIALCSCALLGVDYGHQFSKAMVVSPQAPLELVLTPESKRKDVSGLAIKIWNDDIERVYGSSVDSVQVKSPQNAFLHMKPLLGKSLDEDLNAYHKQHPGVVIESTNRGTLSFHTINYDYSVEELVAMNLEQAIERAEGLLRDNGGYDTVDSLAITAPEYFTQEQRQALVDASELPSGVKSTLVNDGLTVAINFALNHREFPIGEPQYYVVYDMGSGSTRASLISIYQPINATEPLEIEFCGYGYDKSLGGSQLTLSVANLLQNKFLEQHPSIRTEKFESSAKSLVKLIHAAEKAKLILSANTEASINIESLYDDLDFKAVITRQEFEEYNQDIADTVILPIIDSLKNQFGKRMINLEDISSIILTGGSTRVPFVQRQLNTFVNEDKIARSVNADESSVNGVTVRGVQIFKSFKVKPLNVIDRSIFDYYIKVNETDTPISVFEKGSEYPSASSFVLPLSNISADFSIDLYENGRLFKTINVSTETIKSKYTSDKCPYGIAYNATFSLSQNRIFSLDSVDAVCLQHSEDSIGLLEKLFGGGKKVADEQAGETAETGNEKASNAPKDSLARPKKLSLNTKYVHVKPMSVKDKIQAQQHMNSLKSKDLQRLKLQEERNNLETALYKARDFLDEVEVATKGPKSDVHKLNGLVSEYLEWLDYESDDASIKDLRDKITEISQLEEKISLYILSYSEPLDETQFLAIYKNGTSLLEQIEDHRRSENLTLESLEEDFSAVDLDVKKEYYKIKAPRHLPKTASKLAGYLNSMNKTLDDISDLLESKKLGDETREDLFELKLRFDSIYGELKQSLNVLNATTTYRLNELSSLYSRRLRVLKRKEERKKAQESMTSAPSNSTSTESVRSSKTSLESSSSDIVHDEL